MTSSHHGPYARGHTHATVPGTKGCQPARGSLSQKVGHGSDCRLQLACMKQESLVIAGQPHRGECVLGACTHRPSHQPSGGHLKSPDEGAEGVFREGGEVVTR